MEILRDLVVWTAGWADTPYGSLALFVIAFAESSFFPVPPDVLMIPLALMATSRALVFAGVATLASLVGGSFGFLIGAKGGRPVLRRLFSPQKIAMVQDYYQRYDVWAVSVGGFTPLPYKLFSISAGAFGLGFKRFLAASLLGRGGRFFLVGLVITIFGEPVKYYLDKYFDLAVVAFTLMLIGGFAAVSLVARWRARRSPPAVAMAPGSDPAEPV
ncbi:MAG: DedA family protein [Anaerolineae bacterium]|nr:DedA family protein [Anaerolineae bacterium]